MAPIEPTRIAGVYSDGRSLYTENLTPGLAVYGERLRRVGGIEYRTWNPKRSKLAALLHETMDFFPFGEDSRVLYLGAGDGTTVSHISDLCPKGAIFAVDVSPIPFRKLHALGEARRNLFPILADARAPASYASLVGTVDVLYQDVAQKDQLDIFLKNLSSLRASGSAILMLKARSVDVTKPAKQIAAATEAGLRDAGVQVLATIGLGPRQRDHYALVCTR